MHRYVKKILLAILMLSAYSAKAQIYEVGFTGGMSSYMGDLNSKNLFHRVYGGTGAMIRYNHNQHISGRLNAFYSILRGSDMRGDQPYMILPISKQFEFETDLIELSIQAEINFLPFITGNTDTRFSPYLFGGLGGIYFNPRANSNAHTTNPTVINFDDDDIINDWGNELRPGEYSNFSIISIFGYGFKYNLSENFIAGIEWGMRYAGAPLLNRYGTDYLDMVSLKGNPKNNDWYSVLGFTFTYKFLDRSQPPCPNHNL
jgi:hypothetical protein